jgi:hypothetical protein
MNEERPSGERRGPDVRDAQSGIGQEECFDEFLSYTRIKNVDMRW